MKRGGTVCYPGGPGARGARERLKGTGEKLLNLLYPRCCPVCHRILKDQRQMVCPECANRPRLVREPRCMKCGRPVKTEEEYCPQCASGERKFTCGRSIYLYDGLMKASVLKYKYFGRREYGDFYSAAMCHYARKEILRWKPDVIVPIPLHKRKKRLRGFNQSEYLAVRIGRAFGIPVSTEILLKVKNTGSQKKLDAARRRRNLQRAFAVTEPLEGLSILLIDDVFTTGSTMDAAAGILRRAGAEKVYFLTLCTGIQ